MLIEVASGAVARVLLFLQLDVQGVHADDHPDKVEDDHVCPVGPQQVAQLDHLLWSLGVTGSEASGCLLVLILEPEIINSHEFVNHFEIKLNVCLTFIRYA